MATSDAIHRLTQELTDRLSAARENATPTQPLKKLVQEAVSKLDLVTRDDYERLLQIHQRTRQKVDELAKRVDELERKNQ
ncbi:accessory factor UbiK family protein [Marinospirillum perlucidum]|uniref:accessory factor UbiK family protein n=1 Tax=Marinospirillum perlucidum TaxID=1982602 RepID=UPI000DF25A21|nr:accessory factor UbiK family protein [Marinospirillum perlucidum]